MTETITLLPGILSGKKNLRKNLQQSSMEKSRMFIPMIVLLACAVNVCAQDWPQFLGPERNSTSPQKGILRAWPATGPEVLWTAAIGIGYGGPVVKDG